MKKYYLGLVILVVLSLGLVGFTLAAGKDSKKDEETSKKVESVSNRLMDYIYQEGRLPSSFEEANIKNAPSTIRYERLDNERFKFCVYYDKAGSSFDAGPLALLTGLIFRAQPVDEASQDEEKAYLDSYTLIYAHKKGDNCQTVNPGGLNTQFPDGSQPMPESDLQG